MELRFRDTAAMAQGFKERFEVSVAESIAARGRYVLALTGGSAAAGLYPSLQTAKIDGPKMHLFFGDERMVPWDHTECNYRGAAWLNERYGIDVHPVQTGLEPSAAAFQYEQELASYLPFDVIHLGMGPDGHICSLFPGHRLLQETQRTVGWLDDSPKPPPRRVTLTMPVLAKARALWFLVMGEAKADAVRAALKDPSSQLPAALAHRAAQQSIWFLDEAAASKL
jgi:6-phosphogluconolactonase